MDLTYLIFVIPAMLFAAFASYKVKSAYSEYSKVYSSKRITGADAARTVLRMNGLSHVQVCCIAGELTDHYDPQADVVNLSQAVYSGTSVAAIGVACHEVGHAIQHSTGYLPVKIRSFLVPVTNFCSRLAVPLILIGLILGYASTLFHDIGVLGVVLYSSSAIFQLVTLPTEFNASKRALETIEECGFLTDSEINGSEKVLNAAALTYVAALAVSLGNLLRFMILLSGGNNRRRR